MTVSAAGIRIYYGPLVQSYKRGTRQGTFGAWPNKLSSSMSIKFIEYGYSREGNLNYLDKYVSLASNHEKSAASA